MKKVLLTLLLAGIAAIGVLSVSSADNKSSLMATAPIIVTPSSLKWSPVKGISGVSMAVVWGDPTKAGSIYTVRFKMADGAKIPPHWYNDNERMTVLSGILMFAAGHSMDVAKMQPLGPGTSVFIPVGVHHYVMAKGETMVQSTGTGPFTMNMMK